MGGERKLYSIGEKRLAGLLRRAAAAHAQRDYSLAEESLSSAHSQIERAGRRDWARAAEFVGRWRDFLRAEREGESQSVAPAAWAHLGQELAHELDRGRDWIAYLGSRWTVEQTRLGSYRRFFYAIIGCCALALSTLVIGVVAREAAMGYFEILVEQPWQEWGEGWLALLLVFVRVAGTVLMLEHGILWMRRALAGRGERREVIFLGGGRGGLSLVK